MIKDKIENSKQYENLHPLFKKTFNILKENSLKLGRNEIEDDKLYINVEEYETYKVDERYLEAHKKYIDIQFIIEGEEKIGIIENKNLDIKNSYDKEHDIEFFTNKENICFVDMKKGDFLILYPNDAHMPCILSDKKCKVKKAVAKVLI